MDAYVKTTYFEIGFKNSTFKSLTLNTNQWEKAIKNQNEVK